MPGHYVAFIIGLLVFLGSFVSVETGISVALIETTLGVIGGNFLKLTPTPWLTFLSGFVGAFKIFFISSPQEEISSALACPIERGPVPLFPFLFSSNWCG